MVGAMDLTTEVDTVEDAVFDETGTYVASFILDGEIVGELEFPVYVQSAPTKLDKDTEDGLKKSDVIWIGTDRGGRRRTVPAWFAYKNGKILVVSQREPGPEEQTVPGVPEAQRAGGGDAAQGPRHVARRVHRGAAPARGRGVGGGREGAGRPAPEPHGTPRRLARSVARLVRHRRADAERLRAEPALVAHRLSGRPTASATAGDLLAERHDLLRQERLRTVAPAPARARRARRSSPRRPRPRPRRAPSVRRGCACPPRATDPRSRAGAIPAGPPPSPPGPACSGWRARTSGSPARTG